MLVYIAAYIPSILIGVVGGGDSPLIFIYILPLMIFLIWSSLAVTIKRWHDRDKSWVWIFITFIPVIGGIWAFIENGCLRGTQGPNTYGEDPT